VTHLQQILNGSEREADRIQSVAHNLRLSVTVPSVLQVTSLVYYNIMYIFTVMFCSVLYSS